MGFSSDGWPEDEDAIAGQYILETPSEEDFWREYTHWAGQGFNKVPKPETLLWSQPKPPSARTAMRA